jgi:hypothetical protein
VQTGLRHQSVLDNASNGHVCQYHVKLGDETQIVTCVGIDSVACGPECNADFFNFVWEFNNMLCFRRYAMAFLPVPGTGHGDTLDRNSLLLCLRHYRVASDGWAFTSRCASCSTTFQNGVRHLVGCVTPTEPCTCNVCRRQPPLLFDLASRTAFTVTNNADRFRLTRNVTHSEYVHAVSTGLVRSDRGLPPEFPEITVRFRYQLGTHEIFHPFCAPSLPWHATAIRTFSSREEAVGEIYSRRNLYWCAGCERPLFFRTPCEVHEEDDGV